MLEDYNTVANRASEEIIEKKSRFIASVCPVASEDEARAFIEEIRKKYWDARHHVFAYSVGLEQELHRQSDDGEPAGTGGLPVLQVITGFHLKNTVVVVTRYFGGILLGTGGLVRAYGRAAKDGLLTAGILQKILYQKYLLYMEYPMLGKIRYEIEEGGYVLYDIAYSEQVLITALVQAQYCGAFRTRMVEAANGKIIIEEKELFYGSVSEQKLS